jgi:hypothetical protein
MLDAVAGKFTAKDLGHDFEHQVLISMCMVVVSTITDLRRITHKLPELRSERPLCTQPLSLGAQADRAFPRSSKVSSTLLSGYILGIDPR